MRADIKSEILRTVPSGRQYPSMENQRQDNEPIQNPQAENSQPSSQKLNKKLIVIMITVIVLALAAVSGIYWWQKDNINRLIFGEERKACTMEAKLCPDGSSVGRTGPNCEFAPCPSEGSETCQNLCGDGVCQEIVCLAIGCPCAETAQSCPQDCTEESGQIYQVSAVDILSNPDQYLDKKVRLEEKFCGWGQTTGSASPLFTRSDWCICQNPQKKAEQSLTITGAALPAGVSPSENESIGEILSITGVVKKTANNIPYIEAEKIVKE